MAKKKKNTTASAAAKLEAPVHKNNREELVTLTRQQVASIQQSVSYPSQPPVQAASTALLASTDAFEKTLSAVAQKRLEIDALLGTLETQRATIVRDRAFLEATITSVAKGSPEVIKALNCTVVTRTTTVVASTEAPVHLALTNSHTEPGTVSARCKSVRASASYIFVFTTDPTAPPGSGTTVTSTRSRCEITGQQLGHTLYARVAVVRKAGGQSVWSEPAQILVR